LIEIFTFLEMGGKVSDLEVKMLGPNMEDAVETV